MSIDIRTTRIDSSLVLCVSLVNVNGYVERYKEFEYWDDMIKYVDSLKSEL